MIKKGRLAKQYFPRDLGHHAVSLIPNTELRIDLASIDLIGLRDILDGYTRKFLR